MQTPIQTGITVDLCDLDGPSGNVFAIIAKVRTRLIEAGFTNVASLYVKQAYVCRSYADVLKLTESVVHVERD